MNAATKKNLLKVVILSLLLPFAAASAEEQKTPPSAPEEGGSEPEVMGGAAVPSYFVVAAFLRRAQIVMERPLEQRPDLLATFGCAPGDPRFEKCAELIKKAADVYARKIDDAKSPQERQAELDAKGQETGQLYGQLLQLIGKTPEAAAAFHKWVEEVRATVGVAISEDPGNNLLQPARLFDRELEAAYPEYRKLPGFVPAPAKKQA